MTKLTNFSLAHALVPLLLLYLFFAAALTAKAADIYIDRDCSLASAIEAANDDDAEGSCESGQGDDTIILTRNVQPGDEIPIITSKILFDGKNYSYLADRGERLFKVVNGDLTIKNLKMTYLKPRRDNVMLVRDGRLTIVDSVIENCTAGIHQDRSYTVIRGNSSICGLPAEQVVRGKYSFTVEPPPPVLLPNTCAMLPNSSASVMARYGAHSGVQCQQVDAGGIGIQSVIDAGILAAVDVWGYVEQGVEICFPQLGAIVFLDAATAPRSMMPVPAYRTATGTCADLDRPGTVVLVPGTIAAVRGPGQPSAPAAAPAPSAPLPVTTGCPIMTTGHLKLRAAPSLEAEVLAYVLRGSTLGVVARTSFWYQVNSQGQTGWIGGKYVVGAAGCG